MILDHTAAAALFAIVVGGTQGQEALGKQRPWHVEDRGDALLVVGTPYTYGKLVRYVKCHIFFAKKDAEVLGFGCDGRQILSQSEEKDWRSKLSAKQYDAIFAEAFDWERDGVRDAVLALYGGVVNTPADAVAYAKVLLRATPRGAMLSEGFLTAVEHDDIWHIARAPMVADVMTFSRTTGKLLSPLP